MDESADTRQRLSNRIDQKQQAIRVYLGRERPRRNRLSNISIVGSALAAMLTAGPAVGGSGFTQAIQGIFRLEEESVVWRFLCLAAVIFSVAAALATNFANSRALGEKVSAAESANAQLEGLQLSLSFGSLAVEDALKLYQQAVAQVAFVDEAPAR